MAKLVICLEPGHPYIKRGDVEETVESNVELGGPNYRNKLIVDVKSFTAKEFIELANQLNPATRYTPKYSLIEVEKDGAWIPITREPKCRANLELLIDSPNIATLESVGTEQIEALSILTGLGSPCVYLQLDELRV